MIFYAKICINVLYEKQGMQGFLKGKPETKGRFHCRYNQYLKNFIIYLIINRIR